MNDIQQAEERRQASDGEHYMFVVRGKVRFYKKPFQDPPDKEKNDEFTIGDCQCHLCGKPTAEPGCPLCPDCIEGQREQERDARAEAEQRRRPL